jgi:hypothetical protein
MVSNDKSELINYRIQQAKETLAEIDVLVEKHLLE